MLTLRPLNKALVCRPIISAALVLGALFCARSSHGQAAWSGYAKNAQHTALSSVPSQTLGQIIWQTPVDLNPQYIGTSLYIHYGSPLVSAGNTIIVPVKTGVADSFRVEARRGSDGLLLWQYDSDYTLPTPHNWVPSYGPTLTPNGRLYFPGAGGTLLWTDNLDASGAHSATRVAFFGIANYNLFKSLYNADVHICTPLTTDSQGNVYFGYRASGVLTSGLARIAPDGSGTYVSAITATAGAAQQVLMNCAPALSNDEQTVYVAMRQTNTSDGYLVALAASGLSTTTKTLLQDPYGASTARLPNDGTASPMVAPDDKVYFGVLESPGGSNADRGWLLKFDSNLTVVGAPGAFGWDDTPSLVPASAVPSYLGTSTYLLMAKYNFYAGAGGDGVNKIAILDPNDTQTDAFSGATVMKEVLTIAGVTPDSAFFPTYPNAVREWCINTAVVDSSTHSVLAGSEDGRLYRWDLATNSFSEAITLTPGVGEAYTPTLIGPDGKVYAINNATLFAVGAVPTAADSRGGGSDATLDLGVPRPHPFAGVTSIPFSLPRAGRVRLEILDITGRHVVHLLDQEMPAGAHAARWEGRDASGRRIATGVYYARLTLGPHLVSRKLVFTR